MAESLGTIYYDVDANLEPLLGKMRQAESALGGLGTEMKNTDRSAAQMQKSFDKTERSAASLGGQLNGLTRVIRGVIAAMAMREMAGMVQQYQAMAERVEMATRSNEEFELVQRRLQSTADGTYRSLAEAQELFIRTADSIRDMGYSLDQAIDIQDSMSYAFVTNATSADRARAAISQFTKAVNTGKVSADQWETITSAIPSVINDIADASGRSAAEVRALGAAGKLAARDLTEGLRKSLDDTRAASDGMATDLIDASVRIKNAITVTLVALEDQTGAIKAVTDGMIMASEALLEFGSDSESMATLLNLGTTAAASFAAIVAGRLLTSMQASAATMYENTIAARALASAELQAAQAGAKLAAEQLAQAQAAVRAAGGKNMSSGAAARLTVAENAATAATARLTAAQKVMAGSFSVSAAAARGLRAAMAFLGGPTGVLLLAAAAVYSFREELRLVGPDADRATARIEKLTRGIDGLTEAQLNQRIKNNEPAFKRAIADLEMYELNIRNLQAVLESQPDNPIAQRLLGDAEANRDTAKQVVQIHLDALAELEKARERLNFVGPPVPPELSSTGGTGSGDGAESSEFKKLEQSYQNQIALAKKTGLARAELAALQRLGAEATTNEKERISELVGQLYELEEQTKENEKAEAARLKIEEEAKKGSEQNIATLAALREQLYQTTLEADDLVQRQAELSLNSYATPDQIEDIRALALELKKAQDAAAELERRKGAFGSDAASAIRGNVDPLSGGEFDNQYARYEAEAVVEEERYASQLQRLQEAKELEIEVIGGYQALEEQMAKEHAARLAQIEQAKTQVLLATAESGFGAMADIMKNAFGEQSDAYKIAFAAQKAFAIAQSVIAIQQGIAQAAANPFPANIAAMATVAAATAGLISNIQSVTMAGGRLAGGPVSAGNMYRVNENGAPEVFSAANGQQFMIPNQRGEVISNRNATAGGGGVVINIHNAPPGTRTEQSQGPDGEQMIDIWVSDFLSDGRTSSAVQSKFGLSPQGR